MIERNITCIVCPMGCKLKVSGSADDLQVDGGKCPKGKDYAFDEVTNPMRMVCTTVKINGGIHSVIPVKTDKPIADKYKYEVVHAVKDIILSSPVKMGDVVVSDLFGTGVNIVAERDM